MKEPECLSFIAGIPTTWNETVALDRKLTVKMAPGGGFAAKLVRK